MEDYLRTIQSKIQQMPFPRVLKPRWQTFIFVTIILCVFIGAALSFRGKFMTALASVVGKEEQAMILKMECEGNNDECKAYISYPYPTNKRFANTEISSEMFNSKKEGDIIKIRYIDFLWRYPYSDVCDWYTAFWTLGVWIICVYMIFWIRGKRKLLECGVPIIAQTTGVGLPRGIGINTIRYTVFFNWGDEQIQIAVSGSTRPGSFVLIIIDPDNPRRVQVYDWGAFFKYDI